MANFGSNPTGGFQFGTQAGGLFGNKPATTQATGLFGAQPANTQPTGFGFGQTPASTGAPNLFGAPAASTGLSFGATPTAGAALPTFGQSTPQKPTGLTFGTPTNTTAQTGLNFGTPAPTATPGLNFGAPAPTATTGLTFGTPASTGLTFGTPASTGLTFGTTTASTGLTFGTPASTATTGFQLGAPTTNTTGFSLGSTLGASTTTSNTLNLGTSTPGGGFSFGGGLGATTAPSTGLFGLNTTSTPSLGLNLTSTTSAGFNLSGTTTQTVGLGGITLKPSETTTPVGLGGIVTSQGQKQANKTNETAPKDQPLPNEIMQSVDEFKKYVKQQKTFCSEICRFSVKEFKKVEEDIATAQGLITEVEKQLQLNRQVAEKLKYDTARSLQHVEMAQRTFDTPPGLQFDNTAPLQFFVELADNFEKEMQFLKLQIESTDKYLKSVGKPEALTPQDLALGMRRLHETFVALAGRLQSVHNQVEQQKQLYLNFRQVYLHDRSNVFEKIQGDNKMNVVITTMDYKPPTVVTGPTPFDPVTNPHVAAQSLQANQLGQPSLPGTTPVIGQNTTPFGLTQPQSTSNLFGTTPTFGSPLNSSLSSSFQLQKPPVGSKRSK